SRRVMAERSRGRRVRAWRRPPAGAMESLSRVGGVREREPGHLSRSGAVSRPWVGSTALRVYGSTGLRVYGSTGLRAGADDGLGAAVDAEFAVQVGDVVAHGLLGDAQRPGDLRIAAPFT